MPMPRQPEMVVAPPLPLAAVLRQQRGEEPRSRVAEPEPPPIQVPPPSSTRHWTTGLLNHLAPSLAFFASLTVHVFCLIVLALWLVREPIESKPLTIAWGIPDASGGGQELESFELSAPAQPDGASTPEVIAEAATLPEFNNLELTTATDLAQLAAELSGGEGELAGSGSSGTGQEGAGGTGDGNNGLADGSFEGMVDYAVDHGLDIVIVFDATGSMGNEIAAVKARISQIGSNLLRKIPSARISLCAYRDYGDDYLVKGVRLTRDLDRLTAFLDLTTAGGGGDVPEAVEAGLQWAISENSFRKNARKVIIVFGDAPPHADKLPVCIRGVDNFHRYHDGIVSTITVQANRPMSEFSQISRAGGGVSLAMGDARQLMEELIVQVFGSQHRSKAISFFGLRE